MEAKQKEQAKTLILLLVQFVHEWEKKQEEKMRKSRMKAMSVAWFLPPSITHLREKAVALSPNKKKRKK